MCLRRGGEVRRLDPCIVDEGLRSPRPPPPLARRGARGRPVLAFPGMTCSHTGIQQFSAPSREGAGAYYPSKKALTAAAVRGAQRAWHDGHKSFSLTSSTGSSSSTPLKGRRLHITTPPLLKGGTWK